MSFLHSTSATKTHIKENIVNARVNAISMKTAIVYANNHYKFETYLKLIF